MTLRAHTALLSALLCAACSPSPAPSVDAGAVAPDSGVVEALTPCLKPEDCKLLGVTGVCRAGACRPDVPCADDLECGLGERCQEGACRFSGCARAEDCATGRCELSTYSCAECGQDTDCPDSRPVCGPAGTCLACAEDAHCQPPGPGYCDSVSGACVHCRADAHCPSGLSCEDGVCVGAAENALCDPGVIECNANLICVTVGPQQKCLKSCNLYTPDCPQGQLCLKLTFSNSPSLVFEQGAPLGVCSPSIGGLKFYRESCSQSVGCQPNLECVPDSLTTASCKAFCDPAAPACQTNELCHAFPGDYTGRQYGLCYADNGFGMRCAAEADCRPALSCGPVVDPSAQADTACRFASDAGLPGLAPCSADGQCRSGFCANDVSLGQSSPKRFCFAACEEDAHCAVGGRQGSCTNTSNITFTPYPPTTVRGCKPTCQSPADCAPYASGFSCRLTLTTTSAATQAVASCGPPAGAGAPGASCIGNADCRSGYCWRRDGRGVPRPGLCTEPCASPSSCLTALSDGGTTGLPACAAQTLNASLGPDNQPNTADDRDAVATVCAPPSCTADEQCPPELPRCAPDADPAAPRSGVVLRCRGNASGSSRGGDPCTADLDCESGACAELVPPSTGTGRVCLRPCDPAQPTCGGSLTCRVDAARLSAKDGSAVTFTACVP